MSSSSETLHQALAVAAISFNQLHYGIGDGWTAPTLERLSRNSTASELALDMNDCSWIASLEYIGNIFGCIVPIFLLDVSGRKPLIATCAFGFFLVWLGITLWQSITVICVMRFVFGLATGLNNSADSIYLAEVTSANVRGQFGTIILSLYYFGVLAEYAAATYLPYRINAAKNALLGLLTLLSVYWMVESPQFLLLKGHDAAAKRSFAWLRGVSTVTPVADEFQQMRRNVEFEIAKKVSVKKQLGSAVNARTVLIVLVLHSLCDATGYTAILNFSSMIFVESTTSAGGVGLALTQNEFTILLGLLQLVASFFALAIIDRCSRRGLLMVTFAFMTVANFISAVLLYAKQYSLISTPHYPWLIFASVTVYVSVMALGYPAIYTIRGELFPLSVKALGGCAVIICNSVVNFVTSKSFLHITAGYGVYMNFVIYSVAGVILLFFIYYCVPETRRKTLTDIQDNLHGERLYTKG